MPVQPAQPFHRNHHPAGLGIGIAARQLGHRLRPGNAVGRQSGRLLIAGDRLGQAGIEQLRISGRGCGRKADAGQPGAQIGDLGSGHAGLIQPRGHLGRIRGRHQRRMFRQHVLQLQIGRILRRQRRQRRRRIAGDHPVQQGGHIDRNHAALVHRIAALRVNQPVRDVIGPTRQHPCIAQFSRDILSSLIGAKAGHVIARRRQAVTGGGGDGSQKGSATALGLGAQKDRLQAMGAVKGRQTGITGNGLRQLHLEFGEIQLWRRHGRGKHRRDGQTSPQKDDSANTIRKLVHDLTSARRFWALLPAANGIVQRSCGALALDASSLTESLPGDNRVADFRRFWHEFAIQGTNCFQAVRPW